MSRAKLIGTLALAAALALPLVPLLRAPGPSTKAPLIERTPMDPRPSPSPPATPGRWAEPLEPAEGRRPNRLIHSTSPYLLQHAYNPVDWNPWDEQALAQARQENKPIFLSIGYSACHWCHVMEHESFEDAEVARLLNQWFVAIKVDREERPDLDQIYMTAVQMMTGSGGWPMTMFLTPELKPFFGGTYFPKDDKFGRPGLLRILRALHEAYEKDPQSVAENAEKLTAAVREASARSLAGELPPFESALRGAAEELRSNLDPEWGGFGGAPKFPRAQAIELLLRAHARLGNERYLEAATLTLDKMALGGMYDHLGGGFHRYSVDEKWLVPHFEKMLYDNAQLASLYLAAWQVTGKPFYRRVVGETLDFVLRDMSDPQTGAFYSTLDADSEGEEGKFYLWRPAEIQGVLGGSEKDAAWLSGIYDVSEQGNFERGASILHLAEPLEETLSGEEQDRLAHLRARLFAARTGRVHPLRDDKVLTSWNALMLGAFAQAALALDEPRYLEAARRNARFLLTSMKEEGALLHAYRGGRAHTGAYLEDYAALTNALLDLYEASFDPVWIAEARTLADQMMEKFEDREGGGFFSTDGTDANLIARTKEVFDGATPSPNGVATTALARLGLYTGQSRYSEAAERSLVSLGKAVERAGSSVSTLLFAYEELTGAPKEIALVAEGGARGASELLAIVRGKFLPGRLLAGFDPGAPEAGEIEAHIPLLAGKRLLGGRAAAYVCQNYVCKKPVSSARELAQLLGAAPPE